MDLEAELGDPVLYRRDGMFGYQLATVIDDHQMGVDHVVRGHDLWGDAALQATVGEVLGAREPAWVHLPLVVDSEGTRLSKRRGEWTLEALRAQGASAALIRGWVANQLGLTPTADALSPTALIARFAQATTMKTHDIMLRADDLAQITRSSH